MSLTTIYTVQLIFNTLNIFVDSRLSLVNLGEPLRPVALVPATLIGSLVFLPLFGLVSALSLKGISFLQLES